VPVASAAPQCQKAKKYVGGHVISSTGKRRRWLDNPQQLKFRRLLLQVHLWVALCMGLYIVVISLSGSAVVFRRELSVWMVPRQVPSTELVVMQGAALEAAVGEAYSEHTVVSISEQRGEGRPIYVTLERNGVESERLFDPHAGADMGVTWPWQLRTVEWLVDLHDNLLMGQTGRKLNGIGGACVLFLALSGLLLWWPGRRRWRRGLFIGRPTLARSLVWQLHSAVGFWTFLMLMVWGLTAVYFAWPGPFEATVDYFDADPTDFVRPEGPVLFAIKMHFGRFGGLGVRTLWVLLGFVPVLMFVTGFLMWLRSRRKAGQA
jgi:uncharacterized iron-regulated membrane protein